MQVQIQTAGDKDNDTPLVVASHQGKNEMVKILISRGADLNWSNIAGRTAIFASIQGHKEIVVLF